MTITERVIMAVIEYPGYTAGYYATRAQVSRKQFHRVARQRLTSRQPGDAGWPFSYTAYYPRVTAAHAPEICLGCRLPVAQCVCGTL